MFSLTRNGYSIRKNDMNLIEDVKNDLTVKIENRMFDNIPASTYVLYRENDTKLYIPRVYGMKRFGIPDRIDYGKYCETECENLIFAGKLREDQQIQIDAFIDAVNDPCRRGGIISVKCGGGKSCMALYMACYLKRKTLIIVHKEFLANQFVESIKKFIPTARIGIIKQNKVVVDDCDICISSVQSLSMRDYPPEVLRQFYFVVVDEAHHMSAQVFSQALVKICTPVMMGLTATLKRTDGLQRVFKWFLGEPVIKRKKDNDNDIKVSIKCFESDDFVFRDTITMWNGKVNHVQMINKLASFQPRTEFIIECIIEYFQEYSNTKEKMLILSERKQLLKEIEKGLKNTDLTIGYYVGGMKPYALKESETKDVILATYAYSSEGLDIPTLTCELFATPALNIEQSIGRIQRLKPEDREHTPVVIDIVDDFSIFSGKHNKRMTHYKKMKYIIE
jgi:superfamily II DNA or RNA helicase